MAACKRPAADLDAAQETSCCNCKRRRLRIGSTADYDEMCCLGEGSFGFVVKARHRATGKIVAIKVLRSPDVIQEAPAATNELLHEARFLEAASAGNPYVVASHGLVRDLRTKNLCLAMEYVGPSLHAFLHQSPRLPESTVRSFMLQLLTGAEKMHERGIVHRDIKPANILVGEDGKMVKMCDLGLAMSLTTTQPPLYTEAGTLPYMAPEMLLGKPDYDARVDTWSLGCVMAELITGETLFKEGRDENGQLLDIFHVLGSLDEKTWPGFASLPRAAMVQLLLELEEREGRQHKRTLGDFFSEEMLSDEGFQVLEGLLTCNPNKRLTAAAALKLPWFAPTVQPIKIVPPATPAKKEPPAKKDVLLIKRNIPLRAIPTTKKNMLRIPLAMWKKVQMNNITPAAAH